MEGLYHIPLAFYEVGGKLYVMLGAELVHACLDLQGAANCMSAYEKYVGTLNLVSLLTQLLP